MSLAWEPRVALASLSGRSNAEWASQARAYAGAAFLGGIAIDEATRGAARELVERDRNEFLPADPVAFIDRQLAALAGEPLRPGCNVRTATLEPLQAVGAVCQRHGAVLELNAHCRQKEVCAVGSGQSLLTDVERLREQVRAAAQTGATVSVKVRTEVDGVDLPRVAAAVEQAGASIVHVDAMDSERVVADVVEATAAAVVANNGVRDRETVHEYLSYGADAVSVGRPSDDPAVLSRVREATREWFASPARADLRDGSGAVGIVDSNDGRAGSGEESG